MIKHRNGRPFADRRDHYQEVTDRIVAALEAGTKPWHQPWQAGGAGIPINATSRRPYHGINVVLLLMTSFALGGDPRFCSYKQAADRGWQVRKGERGTLIFFFKRMVLHSGIDGLDGEREEKTIPMLRAYTVFNGSQIDGIPPYVAPERSEAPWRCPEAVDVIMRNSGAVVRYGGDRAFYSPTLDFIQLPEPGTFDSAEDIAATSLHELGHWSGAKKRLDRDLSGKKGSMLYAQEELRAELASVFLGSTLGIPADIANHASYIASWTQKMREDKREIFRAAADAQRIADYLLAFHPDFRAGNPSGETVENQEAA